MIQIIRDDENYKDYFNKETLPVVIWGMGKWGELFHKSHMVQIDDVCDSDPQKQGLVYENHVVLSPEKLEEKYKGKKFYIINSYGTTRSLQAGLYIMLSHYDYDARLINLHTNKGFDLDVREFEFLGKNISMISHIHNCGYINERMSERSIEVAMAKEWLSLFSDNIIEIGAVTPYYFPGLVKEVVDPADTHYLVTLHKSIFEVDLNGKNVLCLSTVEHIGTGQYGVNESRNAAMAIEKILEESKHCLITTPIGENPIVDDYLRKHFTDENLSVYKRKFYGNKWELVNKNCSNVDNLIDYCKKVLEIYVDRKLLGANCGNIVIIK